MILQPIVEGQGDERALPLLLRRLIDEAQAWDVVVERPHRRRRAELMKKDTLQKAIHVARLTEGCSSILVLFDADDDCPKELAPRLEEWAREVAGATPCSVVMANREYEAWFLASIESLRGICRIRPDAISHPEPENPRGAKGHLKKRMELAGQRYSPVVDQVSLTAKFDLVITYQRCRSFRKLVTAFGALLRASDALSTPWPPAQW